MNCLLNRCSSALLKGLNLLMTQQDLSFIADLTEFKVLQEIAIF